LCGWRWSYAQKKHGLRTERGSGSAGVGEQGPSTEDSQSWACLEENLGIPDTGTAYAKSQTNKSTWHIWRRTGNIIPQEVLKLSHGRFCFTIQVLDICINDSIKESVLSISSK
jgi:hypothetical protein